MNHKLKEVFNGKVVNKALTINTGVDEFPRYVVEYNHPHGCTCGWGGEGLHLKLVPIHPHVKLLPTSGPRPVKSWRPKSAPTKASSSPPVGANWLATAISGSLSASEKPSKRVAGTVTLAPAP